MYFGLLGYFFISFSKILGSNSVCANNTILRTNRLQNRVCLEVIYLFQLNLVKPNCKVCKLWPCVQMKRNSNFRKMIQYLNKETIVQL